MLTLVKTISVSLCVVGGLLGCSSTPAFDPKPNDPFYAPIIPEVPAQKISDNGSLFLASMSNSLYSDAKARRVGDIITVVLRENTTATKSASTTMQKQSDVILEPVVGFGAQGVNIGNEVVQFDLGSVNDFEGDARANQSNNLVGNISVTVIHVLPNNNLVVRGEKWLTLNNGDEYIRLTGIVRPADVNPANEVVSTKIANARIQYSGTGSFSRAQTQGWLGKFFNSKWWPL